MQFEYLLIMLHSIINEPMHRTIMQRVKVLWKGIRKNG